MAVVAQSAVTRLKSWEEGDKCSKLVNRVTEAQVVLASQGDETDYIPASVFGLRYIREASGGVASDNKGYLVLPSYDGAKLLIYDLQQATDANRDNPAAITATIRVTVKGY